MNFFDYILTNKKIVSSAEEIASNAVVQSDWNVDDQTNKAYVQNRPFYTGKVLSEMASETVNSNGYSIADYTAITLDTDYVVTIGDDQYPEQAHSNVINSDGQKRYVFFIGNPDLISSIGGSWGLDVEPNDCPFLIVSAPTNGTVFINGADESATIVLCTKVDGVQKLPSKYLPGIDICLRAASTGVFILKEALDIGYGVEDLIHSTLYVTTRDNQEIAYSIASAYEYGTKIVVTAVGDMTTLGLDATVTQIQGCYYPSTGGLSLIINGSEIDVDVASDDGGGMVA